MAPDDIPVEYCFHCALVWAKSDRHDYCPECGEVTERRIKLDLRNEKRRRAKHVAL